MQNEHIEKLIDETLESINGAKRATPKPFLLTRINARLAEKNALANIWTRVGMILTSPAYAIAGILIILLINAIVISQVNTSSSQNSAGTKDEFAVNVVSIYDIENQEP